MKEKLDTHLVIGMDIRMICLTLRLLSCLDAHRVLAGLAGGKEDVLPAVR